MIAACGESLIDMVPSAQGADLFEACPGGCPYNSAIAAARLCVPTWFIGKTSIDFLGDKIIDKLKSSGVDLSMLSRSEQAVTLAFVERDAGGNAKYAFYSEGAADRFYYPSDLPVTLPESCRFLLVGSISLAQEPSGSSICSLIEREHIARLVSFDPNIRPNLISDKVRYIERFEWICQRSAIVKASDSDLEWLYEMPGRKAAQKVLEMGPELVAFTLGDRGAVLMTKARQVEMPAKSVPVVDTIGAGDSFHAALLVGLGWLKVSTRKDLSALSEEAMQSILRLAISEAALDCTKRGAEPPTLRELALFDPEAVKIAPGIMSSFNTRGVIC